MVAIVKGTTSQRRLQLFVLLLCACRAYGYKYANFESLCQLPRDGGFATCSTAVLDSRYSRHWFYNPLLSRCQPFYYRGCGGNDNRFSSLEDCYERCFDPATLQKHQYDLTFTVLTTANTCEKVNPHGYYNTLGRGHVPVLHSTQVSLMEHDASRDARLFWCEATFYAVPATSIHGGGRTQHLFATVTHTHASTNINRSGILHIYEGKSTFKEMRLTGNRGAFATSYPNGYVSVGSVLTLKYEGTMEDAPGFTVLVTVVRDVYANGSCGWMEFLCAGVNLCIDERLQCDGRPNCGFEDTSDETNCVRLPDHTGYQERLEDNETVGVLVGGVICMLLTLTVTVWITVVCMRRMLMKRSYVRMQRRLALHHADIQNLAARRGAADFMDPLVTGLHHGNPNVSLMEAPPSYSTTHGEPAESTFEMPPPYTPDACDTSGLLPGTQGLSLETPPAYRTLPPSFDSLRRERIAAERVFLLSNQNNHSNGETQGVQQLNSSGTQHRNDGSQVGYRREHFNDGSQFTNGREMHSNAVTNMNNNNEQSSSVMDIQLASEMEDVERSPARNRDCARDTVQANLGSNVDPEIAESQNGEDRSQHNTHETPTNNSLRDSPADNPPYRSGAHDNNRDMDSSFQSPGRGTEFSKDSDSESQIMHFHPAIARNGGGKCNQAVDCHTDSRKRSLNSRCPHLNGSLRSNQSVHLNDNLSPKTDSSEQIHRINTLP